MALNIATTRERLQNFDFSRLFIEDLGWANPSARSPVVCQLLLKNAQLSYTRKPIAQLAGVRGRGAAASNGVVLDVCYETVFRHARTRRRR